jgi:hypothetical protein
MNNDSSKLRHTQKQESVSEQQQQQQLKSEAKEFSSVEEMLREDSSQTVVPPGIALKLNESIAKLPKPTASWWQRFFSRE